jgi:hypothetical protein
MPRRSALGTARQNADVRPHRNTVQDSDIAQSATLVIVGTDLDPGEVTDALGLQPWQSWTRGDRKSYVRRDGTRAEFESIHEWGGWKLRLPDSRQSRDLVEQLRYWVELLRARSASLLHFRDKGFTIELNCCLIGDDTINIHIPADVLKELARLHVDLDVSFYDHGRNGSAV